MDQMHTLSGRYRTHQMFACVGLNEILTINWACITWWNRGFLYSVVSAMCSHFPIVNWMHALDMIIPTHSQMKENLNPPTKEDVVSVGTSHWNNNTLLCIYRISYPSLLADTTLTCWVYLLVERWHRTNNVAKICSWNYAVDLVQIHLRSLWNKPTGTPAKTFKARRTINTQPG